MRNVKLLLLFPFWLLSVTISMAQSDEQLWLDFQLSYPFANRYLLENTTSYQTLLNENGKWWNLSISPTFEYSLFTRLDLISEIPLGYTLQKEGVNTFEISPMVGGRFHITQNRKIDTRFLLRYQTRAFHEIDASNWEISNRTRLKGEIYWSINGPNLFNDKLCYAFADYEEFIVLDQQLDERYANRRRGRVGIGYRLNYKHRFDLSYIHQSSRNEIEGEFISNDNIIQLKYKLYLNPVVIVPQN
ncbi:MAG: DUF2490 domain-containing protein [Cyclobacteriaceae bacterium]|nr:DUF2490 domain-containing protein [Cyclobacteriaceae bacterium]